MNEEAVSDGAVLDFPNVQRAGFSFVKRFPFSNAHSAVPAGCGKETAEIAWDRRRQVENFRHGIVTRPA